MDNQQDNPWDNLNVSPDYTPEQRNHFAKLDYLIHKTFAQTESGAELIAIWRESALIQQPTAVAGMSELEIGLAEGAKTFIRNILLTIDKVNNDE